MRAPSNLKDFVYKSIESDLLAGNLHSGDIINEKDLVEKSLYYLSHEKEREAIAMHGYEKVKKMHSYRIRLQQMLDIVFGEKPEER